MVSPLGRLPTFVAALSWHPSLGVSLSHHGRCLGASAGDLCPRPCHQPYRQPTRVSILGLVTPGPAALQLNACYPPLLLQGSLQIQRGPSVVKGGQSHVPWFREASPHHSRLLSCRDLQASAPPAPAQPTGSLPGVRQVLSARLGARASEDVGARPHHFPQASSVPLRAPRLQHVSQTAASGAGHSSPSSLQDAARNMNGASGAPSSAGRHCNYGAPLQASAAAPQELRLSRRSQRLTASTGSTRPSPVSGSTTPRSRPQRTPLCAGAR
ncbi:hypothetical protein NDU88_001985 [Pleurodeles waltl]|uniref:Uncharacterized protein n=1 Tax=Pleurodeles waltl TaxID=8319 RepID=A0AAV7RAP1_PLEWA|nr:hypothetical protein NDU88_001985 [Pleurodeles waltl]